MDDPESSQAARRPGQRDDLQRFFPPPLVGWFGYSFGDVSAAPGKGSSVAAQCTLTSKGFRLQAHARW